MSNAHVYDSKTIEPLYLKKNKTDSLSIGKNTFPQKFFLSCMISAFEFCGDKFSRNKVFFAAYWAETGKYNENIGRKTGKYRSRRLENIIFFKYFNLTQNNHLNCLSFKKTD